MTQPAPVVSVPANATVQPSAAGEKAAIAQAPPKPVDAPKGEKAEKVRVRGYERAKTLKEKLETEDGGGKSEPSEEPGETTSAEKKPEPAKTDAEKKPADDEAAKRRAERIERLNKAKEREREEDRQRIARSQSKTRESEVESLRKRIAELEPHEKVFSSEETLLEAAEAKGMSAEKLVAWMRTRLSDPAAVAKRQAMTETEKLQAEIQKLRDDITKTEQQRRNEIEHLRQQHEGRERASQFVTMAKTGEKTHPLTTALTKKLEASHTDRSSDVLVGLANALVAPLLPENYTLPELHDAFEQLLDDLQVPATGAPAAPATSQSPKNGADQPTTTLSNALSSERASVTEETPLHRMSLEERRARLKAKLGSE